METYMCPVQGCKNIFLPQMNNFQKHYTTHLRQRHPNLSIQDIRKIHIKRINREKETIGMLYEA